MQGSVGHLNLQLSVSKSILKNAHGVGVFNWYDIVQTSNMLAGLDESCVRVRVRVSVRARVRVCECECACTSALTLSWKIRMVLVYSTGTI